MTDEENFVGKPLTLSNALLLLLLLSILLLSVGLDRSDLRGSTEPREAGVAAQMLQDHDYLLPRLNDEPFLEKPPLSYWLQAASIDVFGYRTFAPRLPSVLAGISAVLLVFFFGARANRSVGIGLAAGLMLVTMGSFWMNARMAGQDALLLFGVTLCLLSFYRAREVVLGEDFIKPGHNSYWCNSSWYNSSWCYWLGYAGGLAIATLAKGVIGLAIPGATVFAYLLVEAVVFERRFVWHKWLLPAVFAVLALLPLLVWLLLLYRQHGMDPVREVVWVNSVGRFAGEYTRGSHSEPFYYYLKKLPEMFQPWTLALFVAFWQLGKTWRGNRQFVFLSCWLIAPFILLSLSAGKRPTYLLSLYPAAALLLAAYGRHCLDNIDSAAIKRVARRIAFVQSVLLTGIALAITMRLFKAHWPVVAGVVAVLQALVLVAVWRGALYALWTRFFASSIVLLTIAFCSYAGFILPHDAVKQSARPLFEKLSAGGDDFVLFKPSERISGAARFYTARPVRSVDTVDELVEMWKANPTLRVLVSTDAAAALPAFKTREQFTYGKQPYLIVSQQ